MHDELKNLGHIHINFRITRKSECVWYKFYVKVHYKIAYVSIFLKTPAIG